MKLHRLKTFVVAANLAFAAFLLYCHFTDLFPAFAYDFNEVFSAG
jgi:hypothetical protein